MLGLAFLLHLPWELALTGAVAGHVALAGEVLPASMLAALAHGGIAVLAFWIVAVGAGSRSWIRSPARTDGIMFLVATLIFTLIAESLATGLLAGARHPSSLPTVVDPRVGVLALLQVTLTPLLLWLILPRTSRRLRRSRQPGRSPLHAYEEP